MNREIKHNNKKFPNLTSYLNEFIQWEDAFNRQTNISRYSKNEIFIIPASDYMPQFTYTSRQNLADDLYTTAYGEMFNNLINCLKNSQNQSYGLLINLLKLYWAERLNLYLCKIIYDEFKNNKRNNLPCFVQLGDITMVLASLFIHGWNKLAVQLLTEFYEVYEIESRLISGTEDTTYQPSHAQFFILRLVNQWLNIECNSLPDAAFEEELYNEILDHYDTIDLELLSDLLTQACNRHINESKYMDSKKIYDFGKQELFYYPFEILILLYIRQTKNLINPNIDHIIMNTSLGLLPKPTIEENYLTDELNKIIIRIKQEHPDFAMDF